MLGCHRAGDSHLKQALEEGRVSPLRQRIWFPAPARDLPSLRHLLIALIGRWYLHVQLGWLLGPWSCHAPLPTLAALALFCLS